jgi:ribonucleoside-diphosphate reductase alpha chain
MKYVISQLTGIGGARTVGFGPARVKSLPDAVAKVLAEHFEFKVNGKVVDARREAKPADAPVLNGSSNGNGVSLSNGNGTRNGHISASVVASSVAAPAIVAAPLPLEMTPPENTRFDFCPQCGAAAFAHEEGCAKCYACGHAEC